jgi:predicted CoA-binding protein
MVTAVKLAGERPTLAQIEAFLLHKRFAMVGLSRDPKEFSRMLATEFAKRGYDVVPVNPAVSEIDGKTSYARVQDIEPGVAAALLLTNAAVTESVVRDCVAAGVTHIWMYRANGVGAVSEKAIEFCKEHGVDVIAGECPFMFLPNTALPHRVHGVIKKIFRSYPR